MVTLNDLVRDVQLTAAAVKEAEAARKVADTRLIDGLALTGKPLNVGVVVVIGEVMIKRPYQMLPLELSAVVNVPHDSVVIHDEPSLNPHSDLP